MECLRDGICILQGSNFPVQVSSVTHSTCFPEDQTPAPGPPGGTWVGVPCPRASRARGWGSTPTPNRSSVSWKGQLSFHSIFGCVSKRKAPLTGPERILVTNWEASWPPLNVKVSASAWGAGPAGLGRAAPRVLSSERWLDEFTVDPFVFTGLFPALDVLGFHSAEPHLGGKRAGS